MTKTARLTLRHRVSLMTGALRIVNPDWLWISSHLLKKTAVHFA